MVDMGSESTERGRGSRALEGAEPGSAGPEAPRPGSPGPKVRRRRKSSRKQETPPWPELPGVPGRGPLPRIGGAHLDWPVPWRAVQGDRTGLGARMEYLAYRAALGSLGLLPRSMRGACLGALARLARAFDGRHSDAARIFLRQAFGPEIPKAELEARVLRAWRHLLEIAVSAETLERSGDADTQASRAKIVRQHPDFQPLLASGQGAILVTGHLGHWEACLAVAPRLGMDPMYVVSKPPRNRYLSVRAQGLREARGVRLIPRQGAMQDAPAILKSGGYLAMLMDHRARKRTVTAPFFGRPAHCERGGAALLKRLRVPVVVGACFQADDPGHYEIEIPAVLAPDAFAGRSPEEVAARVNHELEQLILSRPDQYYWIHDRFRGAPEPEETTGPTEPERAQA